MGMHNTVLDNLIEEWEVEGEVIRTIDIHEDTVERIIKVDTGPTGDRYYLYRYFDIAGKTCVSVDLDGVDADRVIQHLGERA